MHYVELREEAVKSWQHAFTDKLMYLGNPENTFGNSRYGPAEIYLKGNGWIECHFVLKAERDSYYTAIIKNMGLKVGVFGSGEGGEVNDDFAPVSRNPSMLVDVAHFVKPPQRVSLEVVPSVIWLKRFDLADGLVRHPGSTFFEAISGVGIPLFENRELCPARYSGNTSQAPDQLIESGAHAIKQISSDKGDFGRHVQEVKPDDVKIQIILTSQSVGFRMHEISNFELQAIQVLLRPSHFQVGIGGFDHAAMLAG